MYVGVVVACLSFTDVYSCFPIINATEMYPTKEDCEASATLFAYELQQENGIPATPYCFETDFFELL